MDSDNPIIRNKTQIQSILSADPQYIVNKVKEKCLITDREYTKLNSINKGDAEDIVIKLVDMIHNKGYHSKFIELLQDKDTLATYPKLKSLNLVDTDSAGSLGSLKRTAESLLSTDEPKNKTQKKEDAPYPLTTKPTGLCVIINNENFVAGSGLKTRKGTDKDSESLATVFSWLGFQVLMCKDLTKDEMAQVTESLADLKDLVVLQKCKMEEWSNNKFTPLSALPRHGDAFVCCVLSHGALNVVRGVDGNTLPIEKITSTFDGANCSGLGGKPKVFFIQACQGLTLQPGYAVDDAAPPVVFIPAGADFLVAMATVEKYQAIRHTTGGSWFIQSLCKQLLDGCPREEDIMQILYRVNDDVCRKDINTSMGVMKQMPEAKKVTLRRRLVFSPCSSEGTG